MTTNELETQFEKMLALRGFQEGTLNDYRRKFQMFTDWCNDRNIQPAEITYENLQEYVLWLKSFKEYAPKTVNSNIAVLRFLFMYVLHRPLDRYMLPYSRVDHKQPDILSTEEVFLFINSTPNLKAKAMLTLLYSCGLRVSEVVNLKYKDISRKRMTVHIEHAKNRDARYVPLSDAALKVLTEYWTNCGRPMDWLFPGKTEGEHVSTATVMKYISQVKDSLGLNDRRITSHSFRHFLGTHMYEAGYDLPYIQKFLGHRSINSTMVYITLTGRKDYLPLMDAMVKDGLRIE